MLRYALLAGALAVSAPAIAQETMPESVMPEQAAPAAPETAPAPVAPQEAMPDQDAAAAQAAPAAPISVSEVVKQEFPAYDKDSTGDLSRAEFSSWVIALKTKAEPAAATDQVALNDWAGKAFAQADKDKSAAVTEAELTAFLSGA